MGENSLHTSRFPPHPTAGYYGESRALRGRGGNIQISMSVGNAKLWVRIGFFPDRKPLDPNQIDPGKVEHSQGKLSEQHSR